VFAVSRVFRLFDYMPFTASAEDGYHVDNQD
jgi:hypothetical protein